MNTATDRESLVKRVERIEAFRKEHFIPQANDPELGEVWQREQNAILNECCDAAIAALSAQGGEQTADTLLRKCHELFTELMDWDSFGRYPKHVIKRVEDVRRELASVQGGRQTDMVSVPREPPPERKRHDLRQPA